MRPSNSTTTNGMESFNNKLLLSDDIEEARQEDDGDEDL
eukprot:CAMPEP_0113471954 /NCGR_PEP_ID=MMETSP0014_2-20120614/17255_1 /TAXON_ID=2857 /ORGANISM="Nitzschia sp." /LENGTH=38 /DNA_ID=CAMNT_0000364627 /DNA_START=358 /DNA_END=474 /DNA_ORIENTATION=- /assembly_acc=CAM_ASM_000159